MGYTYDNTNVNITYRYTMYIDGACSGNPGPGGAAYCLIAFNERDNIIVKKKIGSVHIPDTTNNRAELIAVIEGLKQIKRPVTITVYSDSRYLVDAMNRGNKRNANLDLWEELDDLIATRTKKTIFKWRKRNKSEYAATCDKLAKEACLGPQHAVQG